MVPPVDNLIRSLAKLPGLGRRSAERAALALLRKPELLLDTLVAALKEARASVCCCSVCGGFTSREHDPCKLCTSAARDSAVLCVVEEPSDIFALERSGGFNGRYHALMGKLSPSRQTGPSELRLRALAERVAQGEVKEILLALSTDMEGDATAGYIGELLKPLGVRVTRLGVGLPIGSSLDYIDELTLKKSLEGRREF